MENGLGIAIICFVKNLKEDIVKLMNKNNNVIPVFFSVDDRYVPYLAVALRSIMDNASKGYLYKFYVMVEDLSATSEKNLRDMCREGFEIEFVSVRKQLSRLGHRLHLRDYYTKATYYRFFIPELFPQYDKGLYLDCDIAVTGDIAELYETGLSHNIIAAVTDEVVTDIPIFARYAEEFLRIEKERYFNAGILVMNLKEMRRINICEELIKLMNTHTFAVAQDQDYLNVICYGRVKYLERGWNKTPFPYSDKNDIPKIAHYKMSFKPWHYRGVVYKDVFWHYAEKTPYLEALLLERKGFTDELKTADALQGEKLKKLALSEILRAKSLFCGVEV